jgi:maltose alpha-D-glucosyltransferase / alpha-amylase
MEDSAILDDKLHWYKDAIIYELHIKAFYDSNEDGIGDFSGLLEKLDYLEDLGVTAIWLLPFYPSPLKDDGYDIADYYSINHSFGDINEFKKFLEEAHRRNLKVITELVINHTSDQHHWFQAARNSPKGSEERNYYVWTDDPSQYKDVRIIFQDFEGSNWAWDEVAQQYYWHRFFHHQPDLNYDNPKVQEEVFKMIDFWCKMGVDGFRLDAVPYLFEREGTNGENLPETHIFLKKLRAHIDARYPGTLMLAEANMWPEDSASYFGNGDECHMNYHFPVMPRMFMALQMEDRYPITDIFDQTPPIPATCQWAMFLRNHDELTLEMVTDEERDYMYRVYAKDAKARINLGIRHRLAPLMENDRRKIELMNSLLFSMPGTPVIYYGDEIGMGDNFHLGDRDGVRTPMQWSPDRNAGFSRTNPQQLYLPVILDPQYNYEAVNVETQKRNTSSLLWFMKHLISMRKKYKAFGRGDMKFINVDNPKVLAFTRHYEDETLLIVVNLSKFSQPAEVDLAEYNGCVPVEIFSKNSFPPVQENAPYFFTLGAHSYQWFSLERAWQQPVKKEELVELSLQTWDELTENEDVTKNLENEILPAYLVKTNWFWGKQRVIYSCTIVEHINIQLGKGQASLLLIEVNYKSGLPETYLLPLTFAKKRFANSLLQEFPQAVLTKLKFDGEEGILCDAFYTSSMQLWLFENMTTNESLALKTSTINFTGTAGMKKYFQGHQKIRSRIHLSKYQNNTAITYDNNFFLKVYRKVDMGINPDHEISQYLSQQAKFEYVPKYLGSIEWKFRKGTLVLAMMQEMIENHGDGYSYMLERVNNYIERILAAKGDFLERIEYKGSLVEPTSFESLPVELEDLLGARAADQSSLLGVRTGELHLALAQSKTLKDFSPENFSLHYQRSLFSSMLALIRETFHAMQQKKKLIPETEQPAIDKLLGRKNEMVSIFKKIYSRKLDVVKTRIHGTLSLGQILLTGKDVAIHDFGGIPSRRSSEARLKRSPVADVASMIRSFYYAGFEGFLSTPHVKQEEISRLIPYADIWIHYLSGFFLKAYLETVKQTDLIPKSNDDLKVMLQYHLLEKAVYALNYELINRPDKVIIPLAMIRDVLN